MSEISTTKPHSNEGLKDLLYELGSIGAVTSSASVGIKEYVDALLAQKDAEIATEKAYVNAYAEFVDEIATEVSFEVAFENLNKKLSAILDQTDGK